MSTAGSFARLPVGARERRAAAARDIAAAHECLFAFILAVHEGKRLAIEEGLVQLRVLGDRFDAADIEAWCAMVPSPHAPGGVKAVRQMLPTLIGAWERTQHAVVSGAFGYAVSGTPPPDDADSENRGAA